jgi:hypothetical protein
VPMVSQAENRFMRAAAAGDVPGKKAVGQEFVQASHGEKVGKLPARAPKKGTASSRLYRGPKGVSRGSA